jgi:hypothetical protein
MFVARLAIYSGVTAGVGSPRESESPKVESGNEETVTTKYLVYRCTRYASEHAGRVIVNISNLLDRDDIIDADFSSAGVSADINVSIAVASNVAAIVRSWRCAVCRRLSTLGTLGCRTPPIANLVRRRTAGTLSVVASRDLLWCAREGMATWWRMS